jgi:hypothetical protein
MECVYGMYCVSSPFRPKARIIAAEYSSLETMASFSPWACSSTYNTRIIESPDLHAHLSPQRTRMYTTTNMAAHQHRLPDFP